MAELNTEPVSLLNERVFTECPICHYARNCGWNLREADSNINTSFYRWGYRLRSLGNMPRVSSLNSSRAGTGNKSISKPIFFPLHCTSFFFPYQIIQHHFWDHIMGLWGAFAGSREGLSEMTFSNSGDRLHRSSGKSISLTSSTWFLLCVMLQVIIQIAPQMICPV